MLKSTDAIIFDLGGVILNLDYQKTIDAFKNLGQENFDRLYTQSHQDKIFDRFETGEITATEFRNYMRGFYENPISDQDIDMAWNAMLLDLPASRIALLNELKTKYRIFLFSNTNAIHFDAFRKIIVAEFGQADLLEKTFNQTYYSHLVGHRKPNASAFLKVITDHNLNPARTLFIDDSIQHIEGARLVGINAVHLEHGDIHQLFN